MHNSNMKSKIIILDEPTTGLDTRESRKLLDIAENLRSKGHTIIIVTHSMELVAEYSKRTIVMENGTESMMGQQEIYFQEEIMN